MELNKTELEIILQAVRRNKYEVGEDFEKAIKLIGKQLEEGENITYGLVETFEVLQRYNNLIFKLEEKLRERNK